MTSSDLAHIVTHFVNKGGDDVSQKKLQKLLYYIESWHLVYFGGKSIIDEDFEAWVHGPVLPLLYRELKGFGFNNLKVINDEFDTVDQEIDNIVKKNGVTEDQIDLINSVLNKYASLSSMQLELLTHSEEPWLEARAGLAPHESCKNVISKITMKNYYSSLLK